MIDVLKELEKENMSIYRRKLNKLRVPIIVSAIHYVQRINLIDALKNGSSGKAEAVNVLRSLPDLNKALGNYRDFIKTT